MKKAIEVVGLILFVLCCVAFLPVWLACLLVCADHHYADASLTFGAYLAAWYGSACLMSSKHEVNAMIAEAFTESIKEVRTQRAMKEQAK